MEPRLTEVPMSLTTDLSAKLEEVLSRSLSESKDRLEKLSPGAGRGIDLISEVISSGGKRVRPLLFISGYLAAGGEGIDDELMRGATAWELLHTMALIHDDLIDRSARRRGRPALHEAHTQIEALLAGDLAHALADENFAAAAETSPRAAEIWNSAKIMAAAGQYLDIEPPEDLTIEAAERIAVLKTGSYSTTGPLRTGCVLGGGTDELEALSTSIGDRLGIALQATNDLRPFLVGNITDDMRNGSPSIVVAEALVRAKDHEATLIRSLWGSASSSEDAATIVRLVEGTGAIGAVTERIENSLSSISQEVAELGLEAAAVCREVASRMIAVIEVDGRRPSDKRKG